MWSTPDSLIEIKQSFESEGYEVHTPRLPLHYPKSQMDAEKRSELAKLTIQDYLQSLGEFMETLDHKPILVGHSMGGLLAQLIAAKYPCEQLVLISSAAPAGINSWAWSVLRTFGHNVFKFPPWRTTTNLLLKNIQYGIANTQNSDVHRELTQKSTFESGLASMQISMWFLFRKPPTKVEYGNIKCPVLLISGAQDKIVPVRIQHQIAKNYSGRVTVKLFPDACHWTVGGSHFPQIKQSLFTWLNEQSTRINSMADSKAQAA